MRQTSNMTPRFTSSRITEIHPVSNRKHLPWISSPLRALPRDNLALRRHSQGVRGRSHANAADVREGHTRQHDHDLPVFNEHHESSTIELFYDLFFVANLTTFTTNHEIVNQESQSPAHRVWFGRLITAALRNYIGFFTLLWFTWMQTTLYDVRFSSDSVFHRICKAISFGLLTAFAVCGALYDTSDVSRNRNAFRALSMVLMLSRVVLAVQYGVVLWYVRKYGLTWTPLVLTIAILLFSAIGFLGTWWGFRLKDRSKECVEPLTYISW